MTQLGRSPEVLLIYIVPKWTLNLFTCEWDVVAGVSEGSGVVVVGCGTLRKEESEDYGGLL